MNAKAFILGAIGVAGAFGLGYALSRRGGGNLRGLDAATPAQRTEIKPLISRARRDLKSLESKTAKLEATYAALADDLQDARDDFERSANGLADDEDLFAEPEPELDDDSATEDAEEIRSALGELGAAYPGRDEVGGIGDTLDEWKASLKAFRDEILNVDALL